MRSIRESTQKKKDDLTILTVHEVVEYLRMSEAKVYRLAKERQLPVVRIGKAWRFRKDLLNDWLGQRTERALETTGTEAFLGEITSGSMAFQPSRSADVHIG